MKKGTKKALIIGVLIVVFVLLLLIFRDYIKAVIDSLFAPGYHPCVPDQIEN